MRSIASTALLLCAFLLICTNWMVLQLGGVALLVPVLIIDKQQASGAPRNPHPNAKALLSRSPRRSRSAPPRSVSVAPWPDLWEGE